MPPTTRDIITLAFKEAGVLGVGQTLLAEDVNDGFTIFSRMTAQWQARRWLVPALQEISMPGNSQKSNTIGIGGYFNTPRPKDIKAGYVIQLNTGSNPVSLPLTKIFSWEDYALIAVKDLNTLPDHFFYDAAFNNTGTNHALLGNVYLWPIPNSQYEIHLVLESQLGFPTDLNSIFYLPDEYLEAIHYNLAIRLCSTYQIQPLASTVQLAKVALNTIKNTNAQIPTLRMPPGLRKGKAFNIYNADGY